MAEPHPDVVTSTSTEPVADDDHRPWHDDLENPFEALYQWVKIELAALRGDAPTPAPVPPAAAPMDPMPAPVLTETTETVPAPAFERNHAYVPDAGHEPEPATEP